MYALTLQKSLRFTLYSWLESRGSTHHVRKTVRTAARPEHAILGGLLRERREALGFSQREVAAKLDRTQAYVWKVEQGIQHVDLATLMDWAGVLDTRASELLAGVENS